ncbi:uncharacterized protein LOC141898018 [Acropora palmata]|uniref:uncharacterized protein LOC141898018 n=1 Tax=Acropora palmata TaxID=6131 RepID=UPI003DA06F40
MPHLKVNINGKRYTISGLSRKTCSKQILCALAKVDAELRANTKSNEEEDKPAFRNSTIEKRCTLRSRRRNENTNARGKSKLKRYDGDQWKAKVGREKVRLVEKISRLENKGIQTSNGMLEKLGQMNETQQECVSEIREKCEAAVPGSNTTGLQASMENNALSATSAEGEVIFVNNAKDTDQDTGISELYSDSSFENKHLLSKNEKRSVAVSSKGKNLNHTETPVHAKCVSTSTDPVQVDVTDEQMREPEKVEPAENHFIVAQLIGIETDDENSEQCKSNCVYVDSDCEDLREEIKRIQIDLKLTETKLAEQNQMIRSLGTEFKDVKKNNSVANEIDFEIEHIDGLKKELRLSNQLYEYQKLESLANSLELDRVESRISRKRWHVKSLLKELSYVKKPSTEWSRHFKMHDYLSEGTLV